MLDHVCTLIEESKLPLGVYLEEADEALLKICKEYTRSHSNRKQRLFLLLVALLRYINYTLIQLMRVKELLLIGSTPNFMSA